MNEPLKGKLKSELHKIPYEDGYTEDEVFDKEDVASAVRWLKEQLKVITHEGDIDFRDKLIDKAFADVVGEKKW